MRRLKDLFHYLFTPNEKNNYVARSLHLDFLFVYLGIAIVLILITKQVEISNILGFATDISAKKLFELTNEERRKHNLAPLQYNEKLAKAAYDKAQHMFSKNYWSHYGPDGSAPWDFILKNNYHYEFAGENLAKNFLFSEGVISAWMKSPTHRENILKKEYQDVGFAVVNGVLNGEETTLVVQMFGAPAEKELLLSTRVVNESELKIEANNERNLSIRKNYSIEASNQRSISYSRIIFNTEIIFLAFLIMVLILDFYFAEKLGIIRVKGNNLSHFIFILFIIASFTIISKGKVL
ncbi:MAG: CAP domain-containing protein [Patescibacteria group bacterium]|nr:CAP domain-containing protein [Patescibacteria group bacterium]